MENQIIKQPNGRWALFDRNAGEFTTYDCTPDEIGEQLADDAAEEARQHAKRQIAAIEEGHDPYGPTKLTWGEALAEHLRHAPEGDENAEVLKAIGK